MGKKKYEKEILLKCVELFLISFALISCVQRNSNSYNCLIPNKYSMELETARRFLFLTMNLIMFFVKDKNEVTKLGWKQIILILWAILLNTSFLYSRNSQLGVYEWVFILYVKRYQYNYLRIFYMLHFSAICEKFII